MFQGKKNGAYTNHGFDFDPQSNEVTKGVESKDLANNLENGGSSEQSATSSNNTDHQRDNWSSPVEFLLSCISMSVGLGNIWRFPFVAYENGGGAFLIPYLIVLIFIGRPLYFLEMVLGQFSSSGSVKLWDVVPFAKGDSNKNSRIEKWNFSN